MSFEEPALQISTRVWTPVCPAGSGMQSLIFHFISCRNRDNVSLLAELLSSLFFIAKGAFKNMLMSTARSLRQLNR